MSFFGGGGGGEVSTATITLDNDQIKTLPTIPVEIVPAPGAGYILCLTRAIYISNFAAGAYSGIDTDISYLVLGTSALNEFSSYVVNYSTDSLTTLTSFLGSTTPKINDVIVSSLIVEGLGSYNGVANLSTRENTNIALFALNGANFTGGNAANTLKVQVWYTVAEV